MSYRLRRLLDYFLAALRGQVTYPELRAEAGLTIQLWQVRHLFKRRRNG